MFQWIVYIKKVYKYPNSYIYIQTHGMRILYIKEENSVRKRRTIFFLLFWHLKNSLWESIICIDWVCILYTLSLFLNAITILSMENTRTERLKKNVLFGFFDIIKYKEKNKFSLSFQFFVRQTYLAFELLTCCTNFVIKWKSQHFQ